MGLNKFTRIQHSTDETVNRISDRISSVLNPIVDILNKATVAPASASTTTATTSGGGAGATPSLYGGAHAASHALGGSDPVTLDESQIGGLAADFDSLTSQIALKATDTNVVHLAGFETITGLKEFTHAPYTDITARPDSSLTLTSCRPNTAGFVGTIIDTSVQMNILGQKLLSIRNAGVEAVGIDVAGGITTNGVVNAVSVVTSLVTCSAYNDTQSDLRRIDFFDETVRITGYPASGPGSAVAINQSTSAGGSSKICSFTLDDVEKSYIDSYGMFRGTLDGNARAETASAFTITGYMADTAAANALIVDTNVALTAGRLLSLKNHTAEKFMVDFAGSISCHNIGADTVSADTGIVCDNFMDGANNYSRMQHGENTTTFTAYPNKTESFAFIASGVSGEPTSIATFYNDTRLKAYIGPDGEVGVGGISALPAAAVEYRGALWTRQGGAGVADVTFQCLKSAAGTYSWVAIATG
jgi:hypothetical protein